MQFRVTFLIFIVNLSVGMCVHHTHTHTQIRPMNKAVFNRSRALDRQKGSQTSPHVPHICFLQENGNHNNNNLYKIQSFCTHIPSLYETFVEDNSLKNGPLLLIRICQISPSCVFLLVYLIVVSDQNIQCTCKTSDEIV